ncbi:MAG: hypothetical protein ACOC7P_00215 [Chloroflexota bacterium]
MWHFDNEDKEWEHYHLADPEAIPISSRFSSFQKGEVYWLKTTKDLELPFGEGFPDLKKGWNSIVWTGNCTLVSSALGGKKTDAEGAESGAQGCVDITYADLLILIRPMIDEVLPLTETESPDREEMLLLKTKLEDQRIQAGLVQIFSEVGAGMDLDTCLAAKTTDLGVVFLTVIPREIDVEPKSERLQFVFLEAGRKVGLIAAEFVTSNKYSWYQGYLQKVYNHFDFWEYLNGYSEVLNKNEDRLEEIRDQEDKIYDYVTDPPTITGQVTEEHESKFQRLKNRAIEREEEFNNYVQQYNAQVEDYNSEVEWAKQTDNEYPNQLFYVEEYFVDPYAQPVEIPSPVTVEPVVPDVIPATPPTVSIDTYLSNLEDMVDKDNSYNQKDKPSPEEFKFERVAKKNFVVDHFRVEWD